MLPRLNNQCNIYQQTFDAGGDVSITPVFISMPCRFNQNEALLKNEAGNYNKVQASMHCNFDIEIDRKMIVEFENVYYSVYEIKKVKDLDGNNLFQFLYLTINKTINA